MRWSERRELAYQPRVFSTNVRDYIVGLTHHEGLMASFIVPRDSGFDLFVRVLLPIMGVNKDIVCGTGNYF